MSVGALVHLGRKRMQSDVAATAAHRARVLMESKQLRAGEERLAKEKEREMQRKAEILVEVRSAAAAYQASKLAAREMERAADRSIMEQVTKQHIPNCV